MGKTRGIARRLLKLLDPDTTIIEKIFIGAVSIILTFVIFSLVSGVIALFKVESKSMPSPINPSSGQPVNILMLGMDIGDPNNVNDTSLKRTDTILLLNYNPNTKKINLVSIPRDTLIQVNGRNAKINAAFEIGGYSKIKSEVEDLLNIKVNYLVKVDYNAFIQVVDALGGVNMDIDRNMIYDDEGQDLHINFKAGETVKLDGQKAEEFFRWRKNNDGSGLANGDLDRIKNQQKFFSKVFDKCKSPLILFRIPGILNAIADNVETNMPSLNMLRYGFTFLMVNKDNISMATLAGTPKMIAGQSYLVFDKNSNKKLISELGGSASSSKSADLSSISKSNVRIKILNATKINGLASDLKKQLNNIGYGKVDTGNTDASAKSQILCNDKKLIKSIKSEINIKNTESKPNKDGYENYDIIIVLGTDYKKLGE